MGQGQVTDRERSEAARLGLQIIKDGILVAFLEGPRAEAVWLLRGPWSGWRISIARQGLPPVTPPCKSDAAVWRLAEMYLSAALAAGWRRAD